MEKKERKKEETVSKLCHWKIDIWNEIIKKAYEILITPFLLNVNAKNYTP